MSFKISSILVVAFFLASAPLSAQKPAPQNDNEIRFQKIENAFTKGLYSNDQGSTSSLGRLRPPSRFDYERFRTYDGTLNNLSKYNWGTAHSKLLRKCPPAYGDKRSQPARLNLPSPRVISNEIFDQPNSLLSRSGLRNMVWQWGQFLDHDLDLTESHHPLEAFPIAVPAGDPFFDPTGTNTQVIQFFRSIYSKRTGVLNSRQQVNEITAWLDGSNVYGSDKGTADSLRMFTDGRLLCSEGQGGQFLPRGEDGFFLAGDVRVNEQICLTCMHTLFMREHNRIATEIQNRFPRMNDETIFQLARRKVIALLQAITYNEFLPALIGETQITPYQGYDASVYPGIANVFSGAAYRFGHTMLSNELHRLGNDGRPIAEGNILLADAFFQPSLLDGIGIEPYLMGLVTQSAQPIDAKMVDSVRNFLFGQPGDGGFDLASLNIQRGRDHGLADFNTVRLKYSLLPVKEFSEITSDPELQETLSQLYPTIDDIDPWVGMLVEDHFPGSNLGQTATAVIAEQFERLRNGDRFWYQIEFSGAELKEIETTTLADIIRRNTSLTNVPDDVFKSSR